MSYKHTLSNSILMLALFAGASAVAQESPTESKNAAATRRMIVDVVATDSTGTAVTGLTSADFTVSDNGRPTPLSGFQAVNTAINGAKASPKIPTEVTIVLDTVNAETDDVAYERAQLTTYLRANGQLPYPVTILIFNEHGVKPIGPASTDGNLLADQLAKIDPNYRPYRPSQGFYGELERVQLSTGTLSTLALEAMKRPGRKVVLWIGQGWPFLQESDAQTDAKQSKKLFDTIVALSTEMRLARMTLYAIDTNRVPGDHYSNGLDVLGSRQANWKRYTVYSKPVTNWKDAAVGDVSAQVLSLQSGGYPINGTDKVLAQQIADVVANATQGYVLLFDAAPSTQKDSFHDLKITVSKPGVLIRTRVGYYGQP